MIGALIMVHSDDDGLVLPPNIAPTQVAIIPIGNDSKVDDLVNDTYNKLIDSDITAYVDNTDRSPGFKFAEAEVNGIPVRIEIGARDLEKGIITIARRDTKEKIQVPSSTNIVDFVKDLMETIQKDMFNKALERRNKQTYEAHNLGEVEHIMENHPGFVHAMWCGSEECELKMKEIHGTKSRCILEGAKHIDDKCVVCGKEAKELVVWGIQY
jgi:prolyl-tRNA synthetase